MFYVYLLKDKNDSLYIGYTNNIKRRFQEHLDGEVATTKKMIDIELYYYEAYLTQNMATEREGKLKQYGSSYNGLLKRINLK